MNGFSELRLSPLLPERPRLDLASVGREAEKLFRSFRLHSDMQLSGKALRRLRGELKLYGSGVTDLDACCRGLNVQTYKSHLLGGA